MDKILKNLEDMDPEERRKIRKLLREQSPDSAKEKNMDWMYREKTTDAEDFLLGKRIDKIPEETEDQTTITRETPGALFDEAISRRAGIDMLAKMREDPLFTIRKREEDARRRLLENPIKMKQLQKMVKDVSGDKKNKKKKRKKKKKHRDESRSDSSDEDDELMRKYLAIVQKKSKDPPHTKKNRETSLSDSDGKFKDRKTSGRSLQKKRSSQQEDRSSSFTHKKEQRGKRWLDDSDNSSKYQTNYVQQLESDKDKFRHRHKMEESSFNNRPHNKLLPKEEDSGQHHKPHKKSSEGDSAGKRYGLIMTHEKDDKKRQLTQSLSPPRKSKQQLTNHGKKDSSGPKKKLCQGERERRRQEMLENALWRDKQREANVQQYEIEDKKEKHLTDEVHQEGKGSDFVRSMMISHAESSSVEGRIKRNIYNIQRTAADMEKSFKR